MKEHETKPFSITQCMSNIQYEKTKLILVIFYSTNILKEKHNTQVNTCITYPTSGDTLAFYFLAV